MYPLNDLNVNLNFLHIMMTIFYWLYFILVTYFHFPHEAMS